MPLCADATGILDPKGPVGAAERTILFNALAIMLAIVVPTLLAALVMPWWFRASNRRARYRPDWSFSGRLELLVWGIPILVILFLGGVIWIGSHELDPQRPLDSKRPPLEIEVVALDWKWLFIYPDAGVACVNELVIPAGTPVHFTLTSASVMNSFFVPQLGGMIAAMNGMATQLSLEADHPGVFYGESTQFSGDGFSDMNFEVRAVPPAEFAAWIEATRGTGPALDSASYRELEVQSLHVKPFSYRQVDPALFHAILMQELVPAPGPGPGPVPRASRAALAAHPR